MKLIISKNEETTLPYNPVESFSTDTVNYNYRYVTTTNVKDYIDYNPFLCGEMRCLDFNSTGNRFYVYKGCVFARNGVLLGMLTAEGVFLYEKEIPNLYSWFLPTFRKVCKGVVAPKKGFIPVVGLDRQFHSHIRVDFKDYDSNTQKKMVELMLQELKTDNDELQGE